ncbi:relaxase/mobilization nuclease domain-containing protein [Komagataeibacter europaeus]|uniref:relaxase/mobilization nuclease domain-containing protein n=1 Tax=Komagataeibacter europaeus TaxID=33995 RepID=UPI000B3EB933|nr:VirD2 family relaxase/mobilization nuclease [Komagataeibacter europaeus]ARW16853.1 Dihydropteroate synthase [Komagataeibacter europaeus]
MARDDDFRVRPGRIRSTRARPGRSFIGRVLAATNRAGGMGHPGSANGRKGPSTFGRGRGAVARANRLLSRRTRLAIVKARVVRHGARATLRAHLSYLQREGVTKDGEKARLFGAERDHVPAREFAERCQDDRHHFRFIVGPEDAVDMADLKTFTRELMTQAEQDLGTHLDWVAVSHWNTDNPHVHVIVRGKDQAGEDLVISKDYIREGLRARAQNLVTLELGPRTENEIRRNVERQVEAERWTQLDRQLQQDADQRGIIDLAPSPDRQPDAFAVMKVGRLRRLERMGLAHEVRVGQWRLDETAEVTLRAMGQRNDIIKRIHRGLSEQGIERASASWVLAGEKLAEPVIGRLVARGLDDELKGNAYAVIDGVDGRTHHVHLPSLEAAGDVPPGGLVELRNYEDGKGHRRTTFDMRSDLSISEQVQARGATWLDRQLVARDPVALGKAGFGAEVRDALRQRSAHLVEQGLARRDGEKTIYPRGMIATLREREVGELARRLEAEQGLSHQPFDAGEYVSGTYHQRFVLASGRMAMIDNGLGFQLVPWTPSLEKQRGREVSGIARDNGGVDWSFGRRRDQGLEI